MHTSTFSLSSTGVVERLAGLHELVRRDLRQQSLNLSV